MGQIDAWFAVAVISSRPLFLLLLGTNETNARRRGEDDFLHALVEAGSVVDVGKL